MHEIGQERAGNFNGDPPNMTDLLLRYRWLAIAILIAALVLTSY